MMTLENISSHEMIGLKTQICDSSNSNIIKLSGKIVDETKSMFIIYTNRGFKMIPKKHNTWKFYVHDQEITLSGSMLGKRSHDRLGANL